MNTSPFSDERAREVADLLKVLSNPTRLRILCFIVEGERSVGEIERELGIRQPTLSQQLGELREAGLVTTRREHKVVFYQLTEPRALEVLDALHAIFCAERADRPARPRRPARQRADQAALFATTEIAHD